MEKIGYFNTRFVFSQYKKITNHKLNTREKPTILLLFFWAGSGSAHVAGLNPAGLAGSLAQTNDPAGHCCRLHA